MDNFHGRHMCIIRYQHTSIVKLSDQFRFACDKCDSVLIISILRHHTRRYISLENPGTFQGTVRRFCRKGGNREVF